MKSHGPSPNKLAALVRAHAPKSQEDPNSGDLIALLVHSYLLADAPSAMAAAAMHRIRTQTVDFNEFRISLVDEMVEVVGARYPFALERCSALRRVLYDIYRHHHKLSLDHLVGKQKRDVRTALDKIDGMSPYVASRLTLLGWDSHAVPVDATTLRLLVERGVMPEATPLEDASDRVSRLVKAGKAREAHFALVCAADQAHQVARPGKGPRARPARSAKPAK